MHNSNTQLNLKHITHRYGANIAGIVLRYRWNLSNSNSVIKLFVLDFAASYI